MPMLMLIIFADADARADAMMLMMALRRLMRAAGAMRSMIAARC